jgi:hypothetical protein
MGPGCGFADEGKRDGIVV